MCNIKESIEPDHPYYLLLDLQEKSEKGRNVGNCLIPLKKYAILMLEQNIIPKCYKFVEGKN
jgi:hypothetical protein